MPPRILVFLILVALSARGDDFAKDIRPLLENYCFKCHGADMSKGGVRLHDTADLLAIYRDASKWDRVLAELRDSAMPPDDIRGYAPPFLTRSFFPGVVQVWSGLFVKSAPGWSLLIRPPANIPRSQSYEAFEGIIETDRRLGPLFINIRLTATDRPIEFSIDRPLMQVQPLMRETYAEQHLRSFNFVEDLSGLSAEDWNGYRETVVKPNLGAYRSIGRYAVSVRKRTHQGTVSAQGNAE